MKKQQQEWQRYGSYSIKPNSSVSLNNRHVVNNSAIIKVHLREGFLIFM